MIYKLWIGLVFWLTLLLLYPFFWVLLQRKEWFHAAFKLKCIWSRCFQALLFCPVKRIVKAPLPKGAYIIASNHSSYLDTVFMYSVINDYFLFIGKGELLKWPLFGLFFRKQDIPVHRENSKMAYNALQKAYEAIDRGECIAMYPEGTIPIDAPKMKAFKNGAFKMAVDKQVPIVPITWATNYKIMHEPECFTAYSLPNRVVAVIHEPIWPEGTDDQAVKALRAKVFEAIDSGLPAEYQRPKQI
jgi:1-acyl-sn-glycerol-3-phosphate acyltransferase